MRTRSKPSFRIARLLCLPIAFAAAALGEEARAGSTVRYVVFEVDDDGSVRPQLHRIVRVAAPRRSLTPEQVADRLARPARDEDRVLVRMFAEDGGLVFEDVVRVPRWTRAELAVSENSAGGDIEGRMLVRGPRAFAVRLPVVEKSWLALSLGERGQRPREKTFRDAEFDLDALAADASLPLARFAPEAELRSAAAANSGNRVDILVMGDGYTSAEHSKFDTDAAGLISNFLSIAPYSTYRNFVNSATLFTASPQSGADHPPFNSACSAASMPTCCADPAAQTDTRAGTFVTTAFDGTFC